jgi:hypothetical protein
VKQPYISNTTFTGTTVQGNIFEENDRSYQKQSVRFVRVGCRLQVTEMKYCDRFVNDVCPPWKRHPFAVERKIKYLTSRVHVHCRRLIRVVIDIKDPMIGV